MRNFNTQNKKELFETLPVPRALATLAFPTIISQLMALFYNLADAFFIGRVGKPYMVAAISLLFPVFSITTAVSNLFGVGGGSQISRLMGGGKLNEAKKVCSFSFYITICVSLAFSLTCLVFQDSLLSFLGASDDIIEYARQYMFLVIVVGAPPTVLASTMAHFVRNTGYAKHASFGLSFGALLNVALDPLFMFVIMPPGKEVVGAALATLLSNLVSTIYFLCIIVRFRKQSCLCISPRVGLPSRADILPVFSVGLPSGLTLLFYDIATVILSATMARHGDYQLAALGIVLKAERIPFNTGVGICHGMIPLIAYNYSAKNYNRMNQVIRTARKAGLLVTIISFIFYFPLSGPIIRLFMNTNAGNIVDTTATIAFGIRFLRLRCIIPSFGFLNFHITYCLQAIGDGKNTLFLGAFRHIGYIPLILVMGYMFDSDGLVLAQLMTDLITLVVATYIFRKVFRSLKGVHT